MNSIVEILVRDLDATVKLDTPVPGVSTYIFNFAVPTSPDATGLTIEYQDHGSNGIWIGDAGPMVSPRQIALTPGNYDFRFRTTGGVTDVTESVNVYLNAPQLFFFQNKSILEKNVNKHGLIEGSLIIEDISPQRESTVTAGNALNIYKFKDTTLDFNLNDYLLPGIAPKIVFNSGQLAGYKFEISKYDPATQEITILKNKDEKALDIPSTFIRPQIGDAYILLDILLPRIYVANAEKRLREKALKYLELKSEPAYKYAVEVDPIYFRKKKIVLQIGDIIRLKDTELQVDRDIRILTLTRSLEDEYQYTIELGDLVKRDLIASIQSGILTNTQENQTTSNQLNNSALFNGTYIGTFTIEQGTLKILNIETAANTSAMKALFIDADGKIWKSS